MEEITDMVVGDVGEEKPTTAIGASSSSGQSDMEKRSMLLQLKLKIALKEISKLKLNNSNLKE